MSSQQIPTVHSSSTQTPDGVSSVVSEVINPTTTPEQRKRLPKRKYRKVESLYVTRLDFGSHSDVENRLQEESSSGEYYYFCISNIF